jgi:hypothetical protein
MMVLKFKTKTPQFRHQTYRHQSELEGVEYGEGGQFLDVTNRPHEHSVCAEQSGRAAAVRMK